MAHIHLKELVVEFPVYGSRSLKTKILNTATGGILASDANKRTVVRALNNISFCVEEGDRIGIYGHNGSGKTTLLRVLAGGYEPVSGELDIVGSIASMLSITLGMDVEATGYDNINMLGMIMGIDPDELPLLIPGIAEFTELGDFLNLPLRTYSSGMSMRLAFGIATAIQKDIILMDEWLSVGDASFSDKAQTRLEKMLGNAKILVVASHSKEFLNSICTKILHLEHGSIVKTEICK